MEVFPCTISNYGVVQQTININDIAFCDSCLRVRRVCATGKINIIILIVANFRDKYRLLNMMSLWGANIVKMNWFCFFRVIFYVIKCFNHESDNVLQLRFAITVAFPQQKRQVASLKRFTYAPEFQKRVVTYLARLSWRFHRRSLKNHGQVLASVRLSTLTN